jgi:hypothetical protein
MELHGTALSHSDAWRMFDQWRAASKEIGVMFLGRHGFESGDWLVLTEGFRPRPLPPTA